MWVGNLALLSVLCGIFITINIMRIFINEIIIKKNVKPNVFSRINIFGSSLILFTLLFLFIMNPFVFDYSVLQANKIEGLCLKYNECPREIDGWVNYPYFPDTANNRTLTRLTKNYGWPLYYQLDYERDKDGKGFKLKTWRAFDNLLYYTERKI